jgi:hypothetical protein
MRSLAVAPTVAAADSATGRAAAAMTTAPDELAAAEAEIEAPAVREPETLFGPHIGAVPAGPAWTEPPAGAAPAPAEELTLDTLKSWIAKSKEVRAR